MAKIQYALATAATAPFARMLRFIDGKASTIELAAQSTPIALKASAFSPDGKYVLAAGVASSNSPFRMWKMDGLDNFVPVPVPMAALASAQTVEDICWITDTHVAYVCSVTGVWFGVLNRTNDTIAWTNISVLTGMKCIEAEPTQFGEFFFAGRRTATNYVQGYKRTGDTAALVLNIASAIMPATDKLVVASDGIGIWGVSSGASFADYARRFTRATPAVANTGFTYAAGDNPAIATTTPTTAIIMSKDGRKVITSVDEGPRLIVQKILNYRGSISSITTQRVFKDDYPTITALAATANEFCNIGSDKILVAVNSNTQTTGRARLFNYAVNEWDLVEDTSFAALFDDWNTAVLWVSSGPEYDAGVGSGLYEGALKALLNRDVTFTTFKLALLNSSAVFNPEHTTIAQVLGANEVYGNSWPQGGTTIGGVNFVKGTDYVSALTMSVQSVALNLATTLTFRSAVIYDDTTDTPLFFINFGTDQTGEQYDSMQFVFPENRVLIIDKAP